VFNTIRSKEAMIFEREPEKREVDGKEYTRVSPEAFAMIAKLSEEWTKSLPFNAVYKMVERFHFHLVTRLYINNMEDFREMCKEFNVTEENFTEESELDEVSQMLMMQLDALVGFDGKEDEEMNYSDLPDAEFFKGLGLN